MIIILAAAASVAYAEEPSAQDQTPADFTVSKSAFGAAMTRVTAAAKDILDPQSPFRDTEGHWAESYIAKAVNRGLFSGYDQNRFGPDDAINRGQFITVLYRQAGSPEVSVEVPFRDISGEIEEFQKAIAWGLENQVVNGTGATKFEPRKALSRQEAMTILYNRSGRLRGMETLFTATYDRCFADAGSIADWAKEPMYWGAFNMLVTAGSNGKLKPKENATRAQLAKILVTYAERFNAVGVPETGTETPGTTGIYKLQAERRIASQVTLKARSADGGSVRGRIITIDGRKVTLFPDAEKIEMHYSGAEDGRTYLATVQKESDVVPTAESVLCLDQAAAEEGEVSFLLYFGDIEPGDTYVIYMASREEEGFSPLERIASFRSYVQ